MKTAILLLLIALFKVPSAHAEEIRVYLNADATGVPSFSDAATPGATSFILEVESVPTDRVQAAQNQLAETQAMVDTLAAARKARGEARQELGSREPTSRGPEYRTSQPNDEPRYYADRWWPYQTYPPDRVPAIIEDPAPLAPRKPYEPAFRPLR